MSIVRFSVSLEKALMDQLEPDNCLEIVAVRGKPAEIEAVAKRLKAVKGLKHVSLAAGTTGSRMP